jgi:F0F1-type ATP synthase membrane subunit b/b'
MSKDLEKYLEEAKRNINEDRAAAKSLLTNLVKYMRTSDDRHREVGLVAAKYLETLQRSNEQLVKIATLVQKATKSEFDTSISDDEKDELFDMINSQED